jgi:hypothetical protein
MHEEAIFKGEIVGHGIPSMFFHVVAFEKTGMYTFSKVRLR